MIPQWLHWKLELMQVIVMGFNLQLTHLFEELQPLRKQGWHLWGLNTQSGDAKWCEMSEWTGTPRSFISFSYETSMSRRHCFVRAHAVWLSSHSMTLGAGGLQPPSPICVHGNTSPWYWRKTMGLDVIFMVMESLPDPPSSSMTVISSAYGDACF